MQAQADQLMGVVLEAIYDLTPRAQPSPYSNRWWSGDLTRLRRAFTFWRNQARTQRRAGQACSDLERQAKEAAKEYHDAIRRQRKAHWEDFLAEDANIWKAAKYLEPGKDAMGNKVPPLKKAGGTMTRNRAEQAEQLLDTFFSPPPARIEEEGLRPQRRAVAMLALTLEEVEVKVMAAKPWKAAGTDGLPAMVLWPVVKHRALALFRASLREDVVPHQWRTAMIIPLKKPEKHRGESMATDITPVNTGQNLRSGRRGAHIVRGRGLRAPAGEPLWSAEATVGWASTPSLAGTNLQGMESPESAKLN